MSEREGRRHRRHVAGRAAPGGLSPVCVGVCIGDFVRRQGRGAATRGTALVV